MRILVFDRLNCLTAVFQTGHVPAYYGPNAGEVAKLVDQMSPQSPARVDDRALRTTVLPALERQGFTLRIRDRL